MTIKEARKLIAGDEVEWPEGANGCKHDFGLVMYDSKNDALYASWSDGQRTYLHDKDAVKYIVRKKVV
jgi:hypothetical protein